MVQASLNNIRKEAQGLSRKERMELMEKLIHQLRIEDETQEEYAPLMKEVSNYLKSGDLTAFTSDSMIFNKR